MQKKATRSDYRAFGARWKLVNAAEIIELRATSMSLKLRQTASLMGMALTLGWSEALAAEEDEVRQRWIRLRKSYGV